MSDTRTRKIGALNLASIAVWLVYAVLVVYVVILALAFFLLLFGASPTASFVDWIYAASDRIMQPFRGIFPTVAVTDKAVFEPSLLFAIVIYTLFALVVHALVEWLAAQTSRLRIERERERYYQAVSGTPQGYVPGGPPGAPAQAAPAPQPPAPQGPAPQ